MTTERIKLDRVITRIVLDETTAGALNLRYADGLDAGEPTQAGQYRYVTFQNYHFAATDSDGVMIPDGTTIEGASVTSFGTFGFSPQTDSIDASEIVSFTKLANGVWELVIQFDTFLEPNTASDIDVTLDVGSDATETTIEYWARREDFPAGDFVTAGREGIGPINVTDARYIVRPSESWTTDAEFTDEQGNRRTVEGVSQLGRGEYLELLARRIGVA